MIDNRIQREIEFHDNRFEDDRLRKEKVSKFYQTTRKVIERFWDIIEMYPTVGTKILECGSGSDCMALELAKRGYDVTAIDISQVAVDITRERAKQDGTISNLEVLQMNVENQVFPDATFDLVIGESILHHLDLDGSLAEISRVLKADGRAIFKEPLGHNWLINFYRNRTPTLRSEDEHPLLMGDIREMERHFDAIHINYYGLTTIAAAALANKSGFENILTFCEVLDAGLLKLPPLQKQAWIVLLELTKPLR